MSTLRKPLIALLIMVPMAAIVACTSGKSQQTQAMTPSITYLHLLRHTPFFTELDTDQLRWVIQHSREWETKRGTTIVSRQHNPESAGYWILLDGGWDLRIGEQRLASGHGDPGKWFNQDLLVPAGAELIANDHSYVMHIAGDAMDDMLARGFQFDRHLAAGKAYYSKLASPD